MTILIKYPKQTKKTTEDFFKRKDQELTNLDWARWGGWFDTDGSFSSAYHTNHKAGCNEARLKLKDRQPVELFSKIFEASLRYTESRTITPEPYRKEYLAQIYAAILYGPRAVWFTKNVFPYLIKEEKKDFAEKLLGYRPQSKDFEDWTPNEVTYYLATATEGDGDIQCISGKKTNHIRLRINSSDVQYLSDIKYILEKKLAMKSTLAELSIYKTQEGIKTKYTLCIYCSQKNPENLPVLKNLIKDNVMTLDRKKQTVQKFVTHGS